MAVGQPDQRQRRKKARPCWNRLRAGCWRWIKVTGS